MKLINNVKVASFPSWFSDSSDVLTVVRSAEDVFVSLKNTYGNSIAVQMSLSEAAELGNDVGKLLASPLSIIKDGLRSAAQTKREVPEAGFVLFVTVTNRGEPFDEGIRIEFELPNYEDSASIELHCHTAHELVQVLK